MKTILNLIILNLIQIILTVATIFLLASCARTSEPETSRWITALETLKPIEGFHRAGIFTINGKIYVQNCDSGGNQIWMRYNKKTHTWRQSRYNSLGCARGESAVGPDSS